MVSLLQRRGSFDQWRGQIIQKFSEAVRCVSIVPLICSPILAWQSEVHSLDAFCCVCACVCVFFFRCKQKHRWLTVHCIGFYLCLFCKTKPQGLMDQFKQKTREIIESSGLLNQQLSFSQGADGTRRVLFGKLVDAVTKCVETTPSHSFVLMSCFFRLDVEELTCLNPFFRALCVLFLQPCKSLNLTLKGPHC